MCVCSLKEDSQADHPVLCLGGDVRKVRGPGGSKGVSGAVWMLGYC